MPGGCFASHRHPEPFLLDFLTPASTPPRAPPTQGPEGRRPLEAITEHLALFLGTLGYGVASGALPFFNAELYVIGAATIAGESGVVAIVSGMTIGHMVGKTLLYFAGAGAIKMPLRPSYKEKLDGTRAMLERSRIGTVPFLFVSAATGWPPFYVVAIMAGILRLGIWTFLIPGTLGRLLRFAAIALFPQLITGG